MTLPKDPKKAEEYRKRVSAIQKRIHADPESVYNSKEYKEKMSQKLKGRKITKEWREKISQANSGPNHYFWGQKMSQATKEKISMKVKGRNNPNFGKKASLETRKKQSDAHVGKKHSLETRKKMSVSRAGVKHPLYGKKHSSESRKKMSLAHKGKKLSPEHRRKIRIARILEIQTKKGQVYPNYNSEACEFFEQVNNKLGWQGIHAENGGEFYVKKLGYWLDYYDPVGNVVIEWDEPHHKRMMEKDQLRQKEIEALYGCLFIRLKPNEASLDRLKRELLKSIFMKIRK